MAAGPEGHNGIAAFYKPNMIALNGVDVQWSENVLSALFVGAWGVW
jgi:hypothetical protein